MRRAICRARACSQRHGRRAGLLAALCGVVALAAGCAKPAVAPEVTTFPTVAAATSTATSTATATSTSPAATATPEQGAAVPAQDPPDGASVTISAVGDISLARGVMDRMDANGAAYPFALVAPLVTGDIGFANLEGPLTERGEPWPKGYNFRTPPRFATGLLSGHFNIVTLANNHAMDYGIVGLEDTIAALDAAGVKHAGAGDSSDQAGFAWTTVDVRGMHIAFVACVLTPTEGGGFDIHAWAAGAGVPGVAVCSPNGLDTAIYAARLQSSDFVVVAVHAGDEYRNAPNATQRQLAERAIADGADVVLGAHAHVVQPVELRGNKLIAWGLGNFIFALDDVDLANIPEPRVSLILHITLTKGRGVTAYDAVPVTLDANEDRPRPATPAEAAILRGLIQP